MLKFMFERERVEQDCPDWRCRVRSKNGLAEALRQKPPAWHSRGSRTRHIGCDTERERESHMWDPVSVW